MSLNKKLKIIKPSSPKKVSSRPLGISKLSTEIRDRDWLKTINYTERIVSKHIHTFFFEKFPNLRNVKNLVLVWLFLMSGLLLSVMFFRIIGESSYMKNNFSNGGTYSEGIVGEVKSLNPLFASSDPEKSFAKLAFVSLYDVDTSGKINTELADSFSTDNNFRDFNLKIRQDAEWSDGKKITADDVIFTVNLLKNKLVNSSRYESWTKVKTSKINDYEIRFEMPTTSKLVLYTLDFPILPVHILGEVDPSKLRENSFSQNPVTSGEFKFKSVGSSNGKTTISLAKNEKYFAGTPKLDYFEIVAYTKKQQLIEALVKGEVAASPSAELNDLPGYERAKLAEKSSKINSGIYAFLNNSSAILKDKAVRQSIQKGLDVAKIRSKMSSVSRIDLPIINDGIKSDLSEAPKTNKDEAEKMLDSAGWKKQNKTRFKNGQEMKITLATISDPNLERASKELKNQLENLGFSVEMTVSDKDDKTGSFIQSIIQPRAYDILLYRVDFGVDTDIYAFWHSSQATSKGLNFANYSDAVSDDLLLNSRNAATDSDKIDQLALFLKRWLSQAPAIGIARAHSNYVYRKSIKTYSSNNSLVDALSRYSDVRYWQIEKANLYKTP
ncbi:MAG: ABC transporter substrate-binding protein [bacterium]|nr:ABC transporter substrate-binding protein [bacterium]